MSSKFWKRLIIVVLIIPMSLLVILISLVYIKQDAIVKELLVTLNADFKGELGLRDSHISPFADFPYISIDLEDLKLYEGKGKQNSPIIDVKNLYFGFDLFTILSGKMDIRSIKMSDGKIRIIQHKNGEFNIVEAFASQKQIESTEDEFHLDLKSVQLENIDITKINEENLITIEFFVNKIKSRFKTSPNHLAIELDSRFLVNVIKDKDTTFFKHKHVSFNASMDIDKKLNVMTIKPSGFDLEHAEFDFEGSIDFNRHADLNLVIKGKKSNFDIFMAMAPEELTPVLSKYDNKGEIKFLATLQGEIANGQLPMINFDFECKNAFIHNTQSNKKLDELNFKAHFTTGALRKLESMEFSLTDFTSRPEAGFFKGHLLVKNFAEPDIDTKIISDFDLDFLSKFLNITDVEDLKGKIKLTMNFKDIIDLNHPEKAIEKFKESYFTELQVSNLSFKTKYFHLPVDKLNLNATLVGHVATIKQFELQIGKSDLMINGSISDLPAIIHHTTDEVKANLNIRSTFLDVMELTSGDIKNSKPVEEQIEKFSVDVVFKSSANAFTESANLPVGEFIIENLYGKMKHYPHSLHDFHADVFIDSSDFRIIDFAGMIDKSDFHFKGSLLNYDLWFMDVSKGDTKLEFDITSKLLQMEDVFAYKGENYVPEDYRHEEFKDLKLHGHAALHFNDSLISADFYLDQFTSQMKMHKYKFERFKGRVHYEKDHIMIQDFSGKLGKSSFEMDLNYYLGKDEKIRKRDNHFGIVAPYLDFDELFAFNSSPQELAAAESKPTNHEKGFNIYELPFTDMTFDLNIDHLNYHRYLMNTIKAKLRTTPNHYIYMDTLMLLAADGKVNMKGYFNGSNKDQIYLSPDMKLEQIDLDKLLWKFENFGQDHLVSENIHGKLSGRITGKIHMHRDMVPIINDSELHIDLEVTQGKLEKYAPLTALSGYFKDKNLARVIFDTLKNHMDINKGIMSFPMMTINSSLGFIEVSGKQDMEANMEYYIKVPLKLVTGVAKQKLFGKTNDAAVEETQEDEIIYKDESKKIRYVNIKLSGNSENYNISLIKDKNVKGNPKEDSSL